MTVSRRRFLLGSATALGGLAAGTVGQGAEGDSSRLYDSKLEIEQIAVRLVLGIGREAWQYVKGLGRAPVLDFVERLNAQHFDFHVPTLRHEIPVAFDHLEFNVEGQPRLEKIDEYIQALRKIAKQDADQLVNQKEVEEVLALATKARGEIHDALARGETLRLSYDVTYKQAKFRISNLVQLGQVRVELSLLRPVRMFNGAVFVADLKRTDAGTQVYTSLWADVCIGRREGPLVHRIAAREIGCREGQFLAEMEHEVQVLVNNAGESRLSRMIPELIRRIAEGSLQG
jgi:hypothetical protein